MLSLVEKMDKANGYVFGSIGERSIGSMLSQAVGADFDQDNVQCLQEKYMAEPS